MAVTNEVQVVTVDADGGDFTLTYSGQTTAAIAENATAATVKTRLEALSNIGVDDVGVTGSAGGPWTVTFKGALGGTNVAEMTTDAAGLTGGAGTAVVTTQTAGAGLSDTTLGVPMYAGHSSEPQGPEDALGPGPKRGDYSQRGDGSAHFEGGVLQSYGPWDAHADQPDKKGGVSTT